MVSFYTVVGSPAVIAYLVVGLEWAVDLGTFVCAWWACWMLWTGESVDE
jgi:hypothetical protein